MNEHPPSPDDGEPLTNIHSAAPSEMSPSAASEVAEPPQDKEVIEELTEEIKRDHPPHLGAIG